LGIKDSALFGMQLDFVYDVHMSVVGYTMHMDLDDTFGEAILEMCAANAWRVGDGDFMFHSRYHVSRHATPSMMGTDNGAVIKIYCQPVDDNN